MVGSAGGSERSKEAFGMMALHEALRSVCISDWIYSVFWTIRPRPRVRGGNGCKVGDDNGSLMLMWEDGYCRGRVPDCLEEIDGEDPVRKAFSKMSIQLYNYGEGWVLGSRILTRLMGKVASDKCHKWVFKEPTESEANISNYWQSSFDALPPEWTDQFESGIQTIAVIQAGHGLLQLGSCKIIPEDLHFVLRMRHTFESIGYQSGFYLSQLFSSNRSSSSLAAIPSNQSAIPIRPPSNLLNWAQRPLPSPSATILLPSSNFHPSKLHLPHLDETRIDDSAGEHENEIKWPNGLSFFNALTGRADDAKLLINPESFGSKLDHHRDEFLSLDSNFESPRRMEGKFGRSLTLPARMASASSSTSLDQHQNQTSEFSRNSETGMYNDVMDTFLE